MSSLNHLSNSLTTRVPSTSTPKASDIGSHSDFNMVNPSMPDFKKEDAKISPKTSIIIDQQDNPLVFLRPRISHGELKVEIPRRKKVAIVEIPNPFTNKAMSANYYKAEDTELEITEDVWKQSRKAQISASHPSFSNKFSIKVELFDEAGRSLGTLESEDHHHPGNYCFFCLDYMPESYEIKKGVNVSCVSSYCSLCSKTVTEPLSDPKQKPKLLGKIKSLFCSSKLDLYNDQGDLRYSLTNGNGFLRKYRCLLEAPFLFFCVPHKLAVCCFLDSNWSGKSRDIKLFDYSKNEETVIGVTVNHVERTNEWQEVVRDGQKVSQYKGEEIFLCKEFEVNLPSDASEELKKLIVGALVSEIPSTVDRCSC